MLEHRADRQRPGAELPTVRSGAPRRPCATDVALAPTFPAHRTDADEPSLPLPTDSWPGSIPAVRQVVDEGLDLGALTVIVGENGAGKSTLVEAFAMAFGMSSEGGSTGARHSTRPSESTLHQHFRLIRGTAGARCGFFLRAETMHGFYSYLEDNCAKGYEPKFHEMSHGESFLQMLASRFDSPGLYVLDEPETYLRHLRP